MIINEKVQKLIDQIDEIERLKQKELELLERLKVSYIHKFYTGNGPTIVLIDRKEHTTELIEGAKEINKIHWNLPSFKKVYRIK